MSIVARPDTERRRKQPNLEGETGDPLSELDGSDDYPTDRIGGQSDLMWTL